MLAMKKIIASLFFLLLITLAGRGQDYHTGIGVKIGMAPGISAKYFLTTNAALEGVLTYRWQGLNLTGLGEFHIPVFDTEGMYFFYGGGFHAGVWDSGLAMDKASGGRKLNLGIDGIVGLEHAFSGIPLSLGLDWKPNFNIITDSRLIIDEISFTMRYLIR